MSSSPFTSPLVAAGAKGCEVIVSGKLRAQRAKSMKFKDGYMVSSGNPVREYIDSATRHVLLRQVRAREVKLFQVGGKADTGWPVCAARSCSFSCRHRPERKLLR